MPKKTVIPVPKNVAEAALFLSDIGKEQRAIDAIALQLNDDVEALKKKATSDAKEHEASLNKLIAGLFSFAEVNRDELTNDGKRKTVKFPTGTIKWRMTPPAVTLRGIPEILRELRARRLSRFIRVKPEVDKKAMLEEPGAAGKVPGVTISQKEEFVAKPSELRVEVIVQTDKLKKVLK